MELLVTLKERMAKLQEQRHQLEIQIIQINGHIQELNYLIHEFVKKESTEISEEEQKKIDDKDYVDREMQCM